MAEILITRRSGVQIDSFKNSQDQIPTLIDPHLAWFPRQMIGGPKRPAPTIPRKSRSDRRPQTRIFPG
jgi:hypothetical protein